MTVLVRQNTAGTSQLNGSAPDPVNVPGNTWYASNPTHYLRSASGGVVIPDAAFWTGLLSYNVATARQKITVSTAVLLTGSDYINLNINASTQTAVVYNSGTGYYTIVQPAASVRIFEWSGSGAPTLIGTSSSALPAGPITVTSAFIEHLTSGTLNASVTVGGTTYTSTATVGSPLSGTYAGLFSNSGGSGGITASEILIEDNGTSPTLTSLVVQSTPGTTALNGTAPDPTNVPGLNWFATTASFARLAGGGITNGGAGINTLSYLLPTNLHKVSIGTTSALANGNQYVNLMCNGSANNASIFSGSGYYLYIRGGGLSTAAIIRVVGGVGTTVANFGPLTNGVIDSAFLDCSVSGTVSASVTFGGTTYTQTYTDASPLTGSYAGLNFGDQGGGTVTIASVTLAAAVASYSTRITWAEAQYQASGVPSVTDYSSPMSRGIFRGIERGVA